MPRVAFCALATECGTGHATVAARVNQQPPPVRAIPGSGNHSIMTADAGLASPRPIGYMHADKANCGAHAQAEGHNVGRRHSTAATQQARTPWLEIAFIAGLVWAVGRYVAAYLSIGVYGASCVLLTAAYVHCYAAAHLLPTHSDVAAADVPIRPRHDMAGQQFLAFAAARLQKYVCGLQDASRPVVRFASPTDLLAVFRSSGANLDLTPGETGLLELPSGSDGNCGGSGALAAEGLQRLQTALELTLRYSMRAGHPLFANQLCGPVDAVSVAGDWLTAAACMPAHTFEVAPVFTMMEVSVLRRLRHLVGGEFASQGDGIMLPGGSTCNTYSVHLARYACLGHRVKEHGNSKRLVGFVSADAHYSWEKAFNLCGLGTASLVKVPCHPASGCMDMRLLEDAIHAAVAQGHQPFLIGVTLGTTVRGAFDDVHEAAAIRDRFNARLQCDSPGNAVLGRLWLAVDACWGCSALLSPALRPRLCRGVARADSVSSDLHKLLGATQQCAALVVRQGGLLAAANKAGASYLFQPDKNNADSDLGDKTLTCGRRADAVKAWFMWKARGDAGLAARHDHAMALLDYAQARMEGTITQWREDDADTQSEGVTAGVWRDSQGECVFEVVQRSPLNLCFCAVPKSLRPLPRRLATMLASPPPSGVQPTPREAWVQALHAAAPVIKDGMQRGGRGLVGFQPLNGAPHLPQCFRLVLAGAREVGLMTTAHIDEMLRDFQTQADRL